MTALSNLRGKLSRSRRYRGSFPAAVVKRMLPLQVRVLRKQRGWSQAQLANESKLTQGVISRAEDPDYGNLTVNTLVRIAAGFDCAFIGRFVPFSELAKWYTSITDEKTLEVPSFEEDLAFEDPAAKEPEPEEVLVKAAGNPIVLPPVTGLGLGSVDQEGIQQVRAAAAASPLWLKPVGSTELGGFANPGVSQQQLMGSGLLQSPMSRILSLSVSDSVAVRDAVSGEVESPSVEEVLLGASYSNPTPAKKHADPTPGWYKPQRAA